jgi:hypothetical protein
MSRAEQRIRLATPDEIGGDAYRGTRHAAHRGGRIGHLNGIWSVQDRQPEMAPVRVPVERLVDRGWRADEREVDIQVAGRGDCAIHDRRRRMVAAHRVNGDVDH